jgi:hypothetical protein
VQLELLRRAVGRTAALRTPTLAAEEGDAPSTIVDVALSLGVDLIVMGTHGRRGFKRLLAGSVTEAVLHEARCPVLTVPPRAGSAASEPVTFKGILCRSTSRLRLYKRWDLRSTWQGRPTG